MKRLGPANTWLPYPRRSTKSTESDAVPSSTAEKHDTAMPRGELVRLTNKELVEAGNLPGYPELTKSALLADSVAYNAAGASVSRPHP